MLLERETELAALDDLIAGARAGRGGAIVVEGEPGIGKSSLLRAAGRRAEGLRVLAARGTPLEAQFPHGVTRRLLVPALMDLNGQQRAALLSGAASLAEPVLLDGAAPPPSPDSSFAALHGLYWLTAALVDRHGALLLLVDDVHWADPSSQRFVALLAARAEDLALGVVVAARPPASWTDPDAAATLTAAAARTLAPGRLSSAAVGAALSSRLGRTAEAPFSEAVAEATGGVPLLVASVGAAAERAGLEPTAAAADAVRELGAEQVGREVVRRLGVLPVGATTLTRALAIGGDQCTLAEAARLAELDGDDAASAAGALREAGLLLGDDARSLELRHPLIAAIVAERMAPPDRVTVHRRAARLAADAGDFERAAAHLMEVPGSGDGAAVDVLVAAAQSAGVGGAPEVAAALLRRALSEPPGPHARAAVLFALGLTEMGLNDPASVDRLHAAAAAATDPTLRLNAGAMEGYALLFMGRFTEGYAAMRAAVDTEHDADPEPLFMARLEVAAAMRSSRSTAREAERRLAALGATALEPGSVPERLITGARALHDATSGEPREQTLELVRQALPHGPPGTIQTPVQVFPALAAMMVDDFARAETLLGNAIEVGRRQGDLTMVRVVSAWRALSRIRQGRLPEADADRHTALEGDRPPPSMARIVATAVGAELALERGDLETAAQIAGELEQAADLDDTGFFDTVLMARGRVALAGGRAATALECFEQVGRRQDEWLAASPTLTSWRAHVALALRALGDEAGARAAAVREIAAARVFGAPRPLALALRAAGGEANLREALAVLDGSGAELERARCLVALAAHATGDERLTLLRDGLDLAWRCDATALAEQARAALVAAGARPRRAALTGVRALTAAEARIVALAADGLTNAQIAQALFLTTKTIERHLTSSYRKLGIAGRAQLVAALGGT